MALRKTSEVSEGGGADYPQYFELQIRYTKSVVGRGGGTRMVKKGVDERWGGLGLEVKEPRNSLAQDRWGLSVHLSDNVEVPSLHDSRVDQTTRTGKVPKLHGFGRSGAETTHNPCRLEAAFLAEDSHRFFFLVVVSVSWLMNSSVED